MQDCRHTRSDCIGTPQRGPAARTPLGVLGTKSHHKLHSGLLHNKNRICVGSMHISVNFCLQFVRIHYTVLHAKTAQSSELYLSV